MLPGQVLGCLIRQKTLNLEKHYLERQVTCPFSSSEKETGVIFPLECKQVFPERGRGFYYPGMCLRRVIVLGFIISSFQGHLFFKHP